MGGFSSASSQVPVSSQSSWSLNNIISRTSMFDYSTYQNSVGQALPERLTNFLEDAFHDTRVSEKELDDLLQNIRPDMEIPEIARGDAPEGLKSNLYHHQQLALAWMKKMEEGTNKGGILADDMGLGKTVSTLALMLARRAPPKSGPKVSLLYKLHAQAY
jgi:SNF2 family DNA or RNA helicase